MCLATDGDEGRSKLRYASQIRYVEQKVDALATDGDEGRSKLR